MAEKTELRDQDREALNSMFVQVNREGNGLTAWIDGSPKTPEELMPAQREALTRFERLTFSKKAQEVAQVTPVTPATK